jgi:phosphosulfolactate phosphohydrolase-like enzyme
MKMKRSGKRQSKRNLIKKGRRRSARGKSLKETLNESKLIKRMSRDHLDVLQNIEFILVTAHREDSSLDDRIIADALKAAVDNKMAQDERAISIKDNLWDMHEFRADISDDIWQAGLRTVLQSVRRHSDLRPGSTEYLDFVSQYIP